MLYKKLSVKKKPINISPANFSLKILFLKKSSSEKMFVFLTFLPFFFFKKN